MERRQTVVGDKKFCVVLCVIVGGLGVFSPRIFCIVSSRSTAFRAFAETYF